MKLKPEEQLIKELLMAKLKLFHKDRKVHEQQKIDQYSVLYFSAQDEHAKRKFQHRGLQEFDKYMKKYHQEKNPSREQYYRQFEKIIELLK